MNGLDPLQMLSERQDRLDDAMREQRAELEEARRENSDIRELLNVAMAKFDLMADAYGKTTVALRMGIVTFLLTAAGVIYFGTP